MNEHDPNPDWSPEEKAAVQALMKRVMTSNENVAAVLCLRVMKDGTVHTSGGTRIVDPPNMVQDLAECARIALQVFTSERFAKSETCNCAKCIERRGAVYMPSTNGNIAQA
jgi:hypothetical protein